MRVVRVNGEADRLPGVTESTVLAAAGRQVLNLAEAERQLGFRLHVNETLQILRTKGVPQLRIFGPSIHQLRLNIVEIASALRAAGVTDVSIPRDWDGVEIAVQAGGGFVAQYDDLLLAEVQPDVIVTPMGFSTPQFIEIMCRAMGVDAVEANNIRERFRTNPALLMAIPSIYRLDVREASVKTGAGILVENHGTRKGDCNFCPEPGQLMLVWSTPDRRFGLVGSITEEEALGIADSIK